ncbi:MAG: glycosyltransferase family 39 protein [Nitrososphaerota archaeon]|nr:glycosyltransferase family 39 protein [Nitrososphaerota archaeon]MDG6922184.1 glycosyltransferase family 39 protein [Nitrososphaerota archaeon]
MSSDEGASIPAETPIPIENSVAQRVTPSIIQRAENLLSKFDIAHLLILLLGLHIFAMSFPSESGQYVFDESYYVPAAQDILKGVASNLEHPFFGKIWGAIGIALFGNDFFGWRIFYVIIGVLAVYVFYLVALNFVSREKALLAAAFLGFESLFFIHTSLLLLEGPPILFALIGFLAYFKRRYYLSALAMGLSVLSKEWGVYFVFALILYHLYAMPKQDLRDIFEKSRIKVVIFFAIMILTFAIPMEAYDIIYKPFVLGYGSISNPVLNFLYYFHYQEGLTGCQSTTAWNCYPWNWILPFNIDPSGYYVVSTTVTTTLANGLQKSVTYHPIDWQGIGNLAVWYAIWPITGMLLYKLAARKFTKVDAFIGLWIISTYLPWFYVSLVIHRVEYSFYFINTDPALALGIPVLVSSIVPESKRVQGGVLLVWLAAVIYFFVLFFPVKG